MGEEYFVPCTAGMVWSGWVSDEQREWLNLNVGRKNWFYCGAGSQHPNCIGFDNKVDATAFKLRFSNEK